MEARGAESSGAISLKVAMRITIKIIDLLAWSKRPDYIPAQNIPGIILGKAV